MQLRPLQLFLAFSLLISVSRLAAQEPALDRRGAEGSEHDEPLKREQWFRHGRTVPGQSAAKLRYQAHLSRMQMRALRRSDAAAAPNSTAVGIWQPLGPAPLASDATGIGAQDYGWVSGRATAVAVDPADSSGNTVYIGGAYGGVWKSTNAGPASASPANVTWTALIDDQPTLAVGSIAIQPQASNPDPAKSILLVGTGETNSSGDSYYGLGILRSADAGKTWTLISQDSSSTRPFAGLGFSRIAFSSLNPNLVVAAASAAAEGVVEGLEQPVNSNRGIYYSTDAGSNWTYANVSDGGNLTAPNSVTSVVYNAGAGQFFAAIRWHGFYSSADGVNWSRLNNQPGGLSAFLCPASPTSQACPFYRGELAVVPGRNEMYAWYVDNSDEDGGIWKSTDGGNSWQPIDDSGISDCGDLLGGCGTQQGFYNLELAAVPNGSGTDLYAGAINLYKCALAAGSNTCSSASNTFLNLTHVYGCLPSLGSIAHVHPDQHGIDFTLANGKAVMYFANDGGIYRALDGFTGLSSGSCGATNQFDSLNQTLGSMTQFVSFSQHPTDANTLLGGTQDNGSPATSSSQSDATWLTVNSGDGGYTAIDPNNPNVWFTTNTTVSIQRCSFGIGCHSDDFGNGLVVSSSTVGGDSGAFYTPYILDPQNSGELLVGTCRVWRGSAIGTGFSPLSSSFETGGDGICTGGEVNLVRSLAAGGPKDTPGFSNVIYAGTDGLGPLSPTGGHIWINTNADVGAGNWFDRTGTINPGRYPISAVIVDPSDPSGKTAYVAIMGFHVLHVWKTTSAGSSWTNFNANLPDAPVNALLLDSGTLYAGTDVGVFASASSTPNWTEVGPVTGSAGFLPNVPVTALRMFSFAGTKKLRASTYGRGLWEITLAAGPDFQISIPDNSATVFAGATAAFSGSLSAVNGYASTVNLACAAGATPPPATCAFSPGSTKPTAGGANFLLNAGGSGGDYVFNVRAAGTDTNSITHTFSLLLHVLDFGLTPPAPGSVTVKQGTSSGTVALQVTAAGAFAGGVNLSCTGLPGGASCSFQPSAIVNPVSGSPVPVTLTISSSLNTPVGTFPLSIVGTTSGGPQRSQPLSLNVISGSSNAPDFDLTVSDGSQSAAINSAVIFHGTLKALNGYNSPVNLSCAPGGTPQPPVCSVSPLSVTPTTGGAAFSVSASSDVPQNYQFAILATGTDSAQVTHSASASLSVGFDFSFSNLSPAQTVAAGQTASYNLDLRPLGNTTFPNSVSLTCAPSTLPALTTCAFTPSQVSIGSGDTNVLLVMRTTAPASSRNISSAIALWLFVPWAGTVMALDRRSLRRLLLIGPLLMLTSCGGGGGISGGGGGAANPGTKPGNYSITVTASSGPLAHSVQAALTVQ